MSGGQFATVALIFGMSYTVGAGPKRFATAISGPFPDGDCEWGLANLTPGLVYWVATHDVLPIASGFFPGTRDPEAEGGAMAAPDIRPGCRQRFGLGGV